jgi:hypothetical protein
VLQFKHPLESVVQVWIWVPEHCVVPDVVHPLVQVPVPPPPLHPTDTIPAPSARPKITRSAE